MSNYFGIPAIHLAGVVTDTSTGKKQDFKLVFDNKCVDSGKVYSLSMIKKALVGHLKNLYSGEGVISIKTAECKDGNAHLNNWVKEFAGKKYKYCNQAVEP